jgi:hypothetical protein
MKMLKSAEYAALWHVSSKEVNRLCNTGRVPDAKYEIINGRIYWMIPEGTPKPEPMKPGKKPSK